MWSQLIVLASVVLTANCAPLPPKTPEYNPLLDPQLLPVLRECNQSAEGTAVRRLCDLYLSVVQNDSATHNVTQDFEAILALPETNVEGFCGRLLRFPSVKGYVPSMESCQRRCKGYYEDDTAFTTPLCRLILWRLEVQRVGQVSPLAGEITAPVATQEVAPTAQVMNTTSKVVVTPSGGSNKVEIPPLVAQKPSTEGLATPKTIAEAPKMPTGESKVPVVKEQPPMVTPEAPKKPSGEDKVIEVKGETPKTLPETPANNQSTPEAPKPPEEVKKQKLPDVKPDLEEDPNENFKDTEDDDSTDDYGHMEEDAGKGDPEAPELGDAGIFDGGNDKEAPAANKMEVVDAKQDPFQDEAESNFFTYFLCMMVVCVLAYVVYHNKTKVLALVLEGRRSSQGRGRRKHTAAYRKLDSNLEEAITSSAASRTSQIIY